MKEPRVTILFVREGSAIVAQCLEYDVAAEGDSAAEALRTFFAVLTAQINADIERGVEPLSETSRAPERYWELAETAMPIAHPAPVSLPMPTPNQSAAPVPPAWTIRALHPELRLV